jgi:hypothetical protein
LLPKHTKRSLRLRKQRSTILKTLEVPSVRSMGDLQISMEIRNYMAEMHNDALYYLHEGNDVVGLFQKNRFYRSTIINFCDSVETAMSKYDSSKSDTPRKIANIEALFSGTIPHAVKSRYLRLNSLRNKFIHYKASYQTTVYDLVTIAARANEAPEIVDDFLTSLFTIAAEPQINGFQKNRTPKY